ncbi:hypothetical protein [Oceanobacillus oncorhynchi]|uniref:hypothetical protein n=1 Tax=Oceanobacillus oncorhynchi TaxID=545501 RepID=UPI0034D7797C
MNGILASIVLITSYLIILGVGFGLVEKERRKSFIIISILSGAMLYIASFLLSEVISRFMEKFDVLAPYL